jgi:hypothetical protein
MLPFGVTIPTTVPQMSEFPEGLLNYPVYFLCVLLDLTSFLLLLKAVKILIPSNLRLHLIHQATKHSN